MVLFRPFGQKKDAHKKKQRLISFLVIAVLLLSSRSLILPDKANYTTMQTFIALTTEYVWVEPFSDGLALVQKDGLRGDVGTYGFIDKKGTVVVQLEYEWAFPFSEGLAAVGRDGKRGFINTTGELVIPFLFDDVLWFSEGLAGVEIDGKWGYINKVGEVVIPPTYESVWDFSEGLAVVWITNDILLSDKGVTYTRSPGITVYSLIDKTGELLLPFENNYTRLHYAEGVAVVQQNEKWGILQIGMTR